MKTQTEQYQTQFEHQVTLKIMGLPKFLSGYKRLNTQSRASEKYFGFQLADYFLSVILTPYIFSRIVLILELLTLLTSKKFTYSF